MNLEQQLRTIALLCGTQTIHVGFAVPGDAGALVQLRAFTEQADAAELLGEGKTLDLAIAGAVAKLAGREQRRLTELEQALDAARTRLRLANGSDQ